MSSFLKDFLQENLGADGFELYLGAFGKHPGWDDYMDDLGLETESLVAARQVLYVDGIGGNLNTGTWDKMEEAARIPIDHRFVWVRENQILVGKMWDSRDGKGRARYPMVVCAHCAGAWWRTALDAISPRLDQLQA